FPDGPEMAAEQNPGTLEYTVPCGGFHFPSRLDLPPPTLSGHFLRGPFVQASSRSSEDFEARERHRQLLGRRPPTAPPATPRAPVAAVDQPRVQSRLLCPARAGEDQAIRFPPQE